MIIVILFPILCALSHILIIRGKRVSTALENDIYFACIGASMWGLVVWAVQFLSAP